MKTTLNTGQGHARAEDWLDRQNREDSGVAGYTMTLRESKSINYEFTDRSIGTHGFLPMIVDHNIKGMY